MQRARVARRGYAEMECPHRAVRRIFEQLGLRSQERDGRRFMLEKFDGIPIRNEVRQLAARRRVAQILSGPGIYAGHGTGPQSFPSVGVEGVREQARFRMSRRITRSFCSEATQNKRGGKREYRKKFARRFEHGIEIRKQKKEEHAESQAQELSADRSEPESGIEAVQKWRKENQCGHAQRTEKQYSKK